ncbi:fasciclin domain-containing protein [Pyruvatibacter sp. HU-CL02332]|uniref:fasciclin domain-containing protein n=1 Tax=Pyruvatibacter sp. HU-CL02332 TaxID=3127650 RepID=UPI0033656B6E
MTSSAKHQSSSRPKLMMVTAVWGDWHTKMLLEMNIPTLLAPDNMPALSKQVDVTYVIYTRDEDFDRLDKAPIILEMRRYMKVNVTLLKDVDLSNPIAAHHAAWAKGIDLARAAGMLALLMPPDVAWSSTSFKTVGQKLAEGHQAILMTYLRVEDKSFEKNILALRTAGSHSLTISGNDLVTLCVRSLHPLMAAYLRNSDYFPIHPEMMFWPVKDEGMVLRVLAREMFLFDPNKAELNAVALPNRPFKPGEACFIDDSDDLFAVSLAPLGTDLAWHVNRRTADPIDVGGWWLSYDSPVNDFVVSHKVRWHFAPVTEKKWQAAELASDLFIRRAAANREANRLWLGARHLGCRLAAKLIALSIYTGLAARVARGRKGNIVLLPSDEALEAEGQEFVDALFDAKSHAVRSQLFKAHLVPEHDPVEAGVDPLAQLALSDVNAEIGTVSGQVHTVDRRDGVLFVSGARVVGEPISLGPHIVYIVDKVLEPAGSMLTHTGTLPSGDSVPA